MNEREDRIDSLPRYVATTGLTRVAAAAFLLVAAVGWTAAGYDLGEVRALADVEYGTTFDPERHIAREKAGIVLQLLQIASAALVAVAFLPWLYRVRCNLRSFGVRRLRFGREWTYLGFALPVFNLYRPYQVMSEVWRGSTSEGIDPIAWEELEEPLIVRVWWSGVVAWVTLEIFSTLLLFFATGLDRIQLAHALALGADVCAAVGASLAVLMVLRVREAQDEKARRFQEAPSETPIFEGHVTA